jgi:ubiquitin C-terminal hydrolase
MSCFIKFDWFKKIVELLFGMTKKIKNKEKEDKSGKKKKFVGLRNLGNTCYMNALLQALSSCEIYMNYVENIYKNKYLE